MSLFVPAVVQESKHWMQRSVPRSPCVVLDSQLHTKRRSRTHLEHNELYVLGQQRRTRPAAGRNLDPWFMHGTLLGPALRCYCAVLLL